MARYIDAVKTADVISERLNIPLGDLVDIFAEIPTADVEEVRHGEWKRINHGTICTNCYRVFDNDFEFSNKDIRTYFKRCPECGAKMDVRYAE